MSTGDRRVHPQTGLAVILRNVGTVKAFCEVLDVETSEPSGVTCVLPLSVLERWEVVR